MHLYYNKSIFTESENKVCFNHSHPLRTQLELWGKTDCCQPFLVQPALIMEKAPTINNSEIALQTWLLRILPTLFMQIHPKQTARQVVDSCRSQRNLLTI